LYQLGTEKKRYQRYVVMFRRVNSASQ